MNIKRIPIKVENHFKAPISDSQAFTLIELLVVIITLTVLASLLLPGLARGTQQSVTVQCLNSLHQLNDAWSMYNGDNQGKLAPTGQEADQPQSVTSSDGKPGGPNAQWCPGLQMNTTGYLAPVNLPTNAQNIGLEYIKDGLLYPYVGNTQAYLCPCDQSFNMAGGVIYPHVRSRSMNFWLSPLPSSAGYNAAAIWGNPQDYQLRVYRKTSDLTVPGPANTFLFIDENPQSINDGCLEEDPTYPTIAKPQWTDAPANYHDGGCGISFCDGHAGIKKWRDPVLLNLTGMNDTQSWTPSTQYEPDVLWLVNRATALKTTTAFLGPQGW
ncbi:MAG TPA: type II secretion system protein [Verrucomicrobiae bacterium]|jgi:prepilin-type processing-associated H-X9-DG protein